MRHRVLRVILVAAYWLGIIRLFYFLNRRKQRILAYHNVLPDELFDDTLHLGMSCRASSFENQLVAIRSHFKTTTQIGVPASCIITFDDGYRNNLLVAAPLLARHDTRAIFFVPACAVVSSGELWIDRMLRWVSYTPAGRYVIAGEPLLLSDRASRRIAWIALWRKMLSDYALKEVILREMEAAAPEEAQPANPHLHELRFTLLSASELQELKSAGHSIGCHSANHDILSMLSDAELDRDFETCEKLIGPLYTAAIYSYPYGGFDEVTDRELERCQRSAFTHALGNVPATRPHAIGRITLPDTSDPIVIHAILSGFDGFIRAIFGR